MSKARDHYLALREKHGPMLPNMKCGYRGCMISAPYGDYKPATREEDIDLRSYARRQGLGDLSLTTHEILHDLMEFEKTLDPVGLFQVNPSPWQPQESPSRWARAVRWFRAH